MIQEMNVNDLDNALQKAFKVREIFIENVIVTIAGKSITLPVGIGGQLFLQFTTSRKIKQLPVISND